jgi:hypothetical protein
MMGSGVRIPLAAPALSTEKRGDEMTKGNALGNTAFCEGAAPGRPEPVTKGPHRSGGRGMAACTCPGRWSGRASAERDARHLDGLLYSGLLPTRPAGFIDPCIPRLQVHRDGEAGYSPRAALIRFRPFGARRGGLAAQATQ